MKANQRNFGAIMTWNCAFIEYAFCEWHSNFMLGLLLTLVFFLYEHNLSCNQSINDALIYINTD